MIASHEAEISLSQDLCDLSVICIAGSDRTKVYYKSYTINRTRWPGEYTRGRYQTWLGNNPDLIFPDTVYNLVGYKQLWWNLLNKDGQSETHHTKLRFGPTWINQSHYACPWTEDWWFDYGLSVYGMDPQFYEAYFQRQCNDCLESN